MYQCCSHPKPTAGQEKRAQHKTGQYVPQHKWLMYFLNNIVISPAVMSITARSEISAGM